MRDSSRSSVTMTGSPTVPLMRIVMLPGLDGTDLLLDHFVELAPAGVTVTVVPLPDDPNDDYESGSVSSSDT